jgi:hypothetical protein
MTEDRRRTTGLRSPVLGLTPLSEAVERVSLNACLGGGLKSRCVGRAR